MEHVEYVYTFGMDETELERKLRETETGILSLAQDDDAYAIPVGFHYDGKRLLLRFGVKDDGEKMAFVKTTDTASFVIYDTKSNESWSILMTGTLHPFEGSFDETEINELFAPLRVFDEDVDDVEPVIYAFEIEHVTGRKTGIE
ncbi:pyridoxamine 5'-phosphate oxidase family protein [Haladaptatus sp. NG-SE-30]